MASTDLMILKWIMQSSCVASVLLHGIMNRAGTVRNAAYGMWTCSDLCMSTCRSLRDMMRALDLDGHAVHKPQLSTLAESPSQVASDTTSSGSDSASVTQSLKVGPRVNSLKRSPLGRSVVTALEAELDQVQQTCSTTIQKHSQVAPLHFFEAACSGVSAYYNLLAQQHGKAHIPTAFPNTLPCSHSMLSQRISLTECLDCDGGSC